MYPILLKKKRMCVYICMCKKYIQYIVECICVYIIDLYYINIIQNISIYNYIDIYIYVV